MIINPIISVKILTINFLENKIIASNDCKKYRKIIQLDKWKTANKSLEIKYVPANTGNSKNKRLLKDSIHKNLLWEGYSLNDFTNKSLFPQAQNWLPMYMYNCKTVI